MLREWDVDLPYAFATDCDIKAYGAIGDGLTDDTEAIQNAINSCLQGGTVIVASGTYLSNPLVVDRANNFTLKFESGASVLACSLKNWPVVNSNYIDFLTISNSKLTSISGGLIDGGRTPWYISFDKGELEYSRRKLVPINSTRQSVSLLLALGISRGSLRELLLVVEKLICNFSGAKGLALSAGILPLMQRIVEHRVPLQLKSLKPENRLGDISVAEQLTKYGMDAVSPVASDVACDGSFIYALDERGLLKIGTGLRSTAAGRVYAHAREFAGKDRGCLALIGCSVYVLPRKPLRPGMVPEIQELQAVNLQVKRAAPVAVAALTRQESLELTSNLEEMELAQRRAEEEAAANAAEELRAAHPAPIWAPVSSAVSRTAVPVRRRTS